MKKLLKEIHIKNCNHKTLEHENKTVEYARITYLKQYARILICTRMEY